MPPDPPHFFQKSQWLRFLRKSMVVINILNFDCSWGPNTIPANFFRDISVRLLSWECWDFWRRHDHFRRFPKNSEVFRRRPRSSEDVWSLMTRINMGSLQVLFTSKIRDHEEGIVIYSFYTGFLFLTWVWFTYFWKLCQPRRQQLIFLIRREKLARRREPAWDRSFQPAGVRLTPKAWELAGIKHCLENGENSISENLNFKTFWGGMPSDPPRKLAPLVLEK